MKVAGGSSEVWHRVEGYAGGSSKVWHGVEGYATANNDEEGEHFGGRIAYYFNVTLETKMSKKKIEDD